MLLGLGATDCDNITNITATRISASSVLVNWRYVPTNVLVPSQLNVVIEVFENESATPQQNYSTMFSDSGNHSYYIENLVTSSQHLCFAVRLLLSSLMTTMSPSSGDMAEMDECPRSCLPLSPQGIYVSVTGIFAVLRLGLVHCIHLMASQP